MVPRPQAQHAVPEAEPAVASVAPESVPCGAVPGGECPVSSRRGMAIFRRLGRHVSETLEGPRISRAPSGRATIVSFHRCSGLPAGRGQWPPEGHWRSVVQQTSTMQRVVGDEANEHSHPAVIHSHDHYHVTHHHSEGALGEFEHRSHYYEHAHTHASLTHAHANW